VLKETYFGDVKMKLMTQEVIKNLKPLYAQEDVKDPIVSLKFFTPDSNWTWYVTEGEKKEDGDWLFYSKVVNNMVPEGEWGYSTLSQLKTVRGGFKLPIERDMHWSPKPASKCK
jgi:hypothetical protein